MYVYVCVPTHIYSHVQKDVTNFRKLHSDTVTCCVCAESQILSAVTGCLGPLDCAPFEIRFLENGFPLTCVHIRGLGSSVGIATGYGLDGPGSNPGGAEIFRISPDWPWGPPSLRYNGYRIFPGG